MDPNKNVRFLLPLQELQIRNGQLRKNGEATLRCPQCSAIFNHMILLSIHSWCHAPPDTPIQSPDFKFAPKSTYKIFHCFFCVLQFSSETAYNEHLLEDHNETSKKMTGQKFVCAFCSAEYCSSDLLIIHIQNHEQWKSVNCYPLYAGVLEVFPNEKNAVSKHGASSEIDELINELQKFAVEDCTENMMTKRVLSKHLKPTLSKKSKESCSLLNYACGICKIKFQHGYQLKEHTRQRHRSLGKKMRAKFACVYCPAKFFRMTIFRDHVLKHHNISVTPKKGARKEMHRVM